MNSDSTLSAGLADPVHDSQRAFRVALQALSRPGSVLNLDADAPQPTLHAATARLLLTLTDDETPVWWQQSDVAAQQWLRFHTSAPLTARTQEAAFAVITVPASAPELSAFCSGSGASPETSSTLLIEVSSLVDGPAMHWSGPGIRDTHTVGIAGLAPDFWTQWSANQAQFPQGVDVIFCCANALVGLPRSTRVRALEEL